MGGAASSGDNHGRRRSIVTTHCHYWDENEQEMGGTRIRDSRGSGDSTDSTGSAPYDSVSFALSV